MKASQTKSKTGKTQSGTAGTGKAKSCTNLWNNAVRQKKLDRETAFYQWKVTATVQKISKSGARKVLRELVLSNERKAFDKWLRIIREKKTQEKLKNLEEEKIKMKIGKPGASWR
jgi:hypothetical protein